MSKENISTSGIIERIIFTAPNGYKVFSMRTLGEGKKLTCQGNDLLDVHAGLTVIVTGKMEDSKYGKQLKVSDLQIRLPENSASLYLYLSSGLFEGIGEARAKSIIKEFGDDTEKVIEEEPEKLTRIKGITKDMAKKISETWYSNKQISELYEFLAGAGVTTNACKKIFEELGEKAVAIINSNAYRLALEVDGFGFIKADQIAQGIGYKLTDIRRIDAGINWILKDHSDQNGHLYLREDSLIKQTQKLLGYKDADKIIERLNVILSDNAPKEMKLAYKEINGERCYYFAKYLELEEELCRAINDLKSLKTDYVYDLSLTKSLKKLEKDGVILSGEQQLAVRGALENRLFVISGRPGTGKTTILKCLVNTLEDIGMDVYLTAPTGKASRRISESTGFEASTIHSHVFKQKDSWKFKFDSKGISKKPQRVFIVDESSMIDLKLLRLIFASEFRDSHIVFLGDARQLPPIGLGDIFRCMIEEESIHSMELTRIYRQADGSGILDFLSSIESNDPSLPLLQKIEDLDKDAVMLTFKEDNRQSKIIELYMRYYNLGKDIQILSPKREGSTGVETLNNILREKVNPPNPSKTEIKIGYRLFRVGDKVMFTENQKDSNVSNGDIGIIKRIDLEKRTAVIDLGTETFTLKELSTLEHAYAITIHKSQGSEYEIVLLCIFSEAYFMLNKNLLYTGSSRAKKKLLLFSDRPSLRMCINRGEVSIRESDMGNLLSAQNKKKKSKKKTA